MTSKANKTSPNTSQMEQADNNDFIKDDEFENLLPSLNDEDYKRLEKSILKDGCRDPLVVWKTEEEEDDILVDGYNRYNICKEHNLPYKVEKKSFKDRDSAIEWAIENQKSRRNMNKFLWAEVILKRKAHIAEIAKKNQGKGGGSVHQKSDKPVNTLERLANLAGVSHDTMHKVEFILEKAAADPDNKELKNLILSLGRKEKGISINSVYNDLREQKDEEETEKPTKSKEKSSMEPAQKHINQVWRVVKRSSKDSAGQIAFVISALDRIEEEFQQTGDHTDFYDKMIEWAKKRKVVSASTKK